MKYETESIICKEWYKEVPIQTLRIDDLTRTYCGICNDIARIEKDGSLAATLKRSLQFKGGVASKLMTTIKTHKGPGDVTFMNIHSSAGNMFAGVGIWIAKEIRKTTKIGIILSMKHHSYSRTSKK